MLELFQKILKDGLTPNQLLILIGKNESISFPIQNIPQELSALIALELIGIDPSIVMAEKPEQYIMTPKGISLCAKYNNYFTVSKKRTSSQLMGKSYFDMIKGYRNSFPAGKLPSGKPARVNIKTLENAFRWFFESYDYTWEEVTKATVMYLNQYEEKDYMYMKTSQYFICKQDKHKVKHSELADYCDMIRDGVTEMDTKHFNEKVV